MLMRRHRRTFWYIDSLTRKVAVYDFDLEAGTVSNKRVAIDYALDDQLGFPDGMSIDSNDRLWIASYVGGRVRVMHCSDIVMTVWPQVTQWDGYNGELLQTVHMPAPKYAHLHRRHMIDINASASRRAALAGRAWMYCTAPAHAMA